MMAITSVIGGFTEAAFLVLVTRAAFAITDGKDRMGTLANHTVGIPAAMVMMFALVALRIGMAVASNWYSARLTSQVAADLRRRLALSFLNSSWALQQASPSGRLQELVTGFAHAGSNLIFSFASGVISGCSVGAMLVLAVGVDPLGSLLAVGAVAALGSLLRPLRRRVHVHARQMANDGMDLATTTNEVAALGMVTHVFDVRAQVADRISGVLDAGRRSTQRLLMVRGLVPAIYSGLAYIVLVGAVGVASMSETAKLTSLGAVMLVMLRSLSYGQQLQVAYSGMSSSLPQVRDIYSEIARYEAGAVLSGGELVRHVCPIELRSVSFAYVEGHAVLEDISAEVREGEMIGVVGPSGSGKSTLVQLLLGLRQPSSGRVTAAGTDVGALRHSEWARRVTFVPQSPLLITGTIADNIRFYRDGFTDEAVQRAAQLSGLHDEIDMFPDGYQHQVGDRGGNLSGGQQQRLCIARALVGHPDVLILDEPTSALDARSEALIRQTLESLRRQMTIIVIAHRLSTIEQCDRIMVIQHGRIAAFDTPEALKRSENFYAEAVRLSSLS